jgi:hypothetical protein
VAIEARQGLAQDDHAIDAVRAGEQARKRRRGQH